MQKILYPQKYSAVQQTSGALQNNADLAACHLS